MYVAVVLCRFLSLLCQWQYLTLSGLPSERETQSKTSGTVVKVFETLSNSLRGISKGVTVFHWLPYTFPWKIPQTIEIEIYKFLDQKLNNPSTSGYNRVRWQFYKSSLYIV